jgi:EmrB/QacA subfamily drug resistance transporter
MAPDRLDRGVLKVAGVVVLGVVMSTLDTTVINVALQQLSLHFKTSFDTIQWVVTGYMLALAAVIPLTGWAAERFGTKRLYMTAIGTFLVGSVLAGLSWNVQSMIVFRVLQGLGGGMLMPVGMMLVTMTAGPQRIGRVMAVLGVPMMLGPICGPILGGFLVDQVSWRWIFFINVPVGLVALVLTARVLPRDTPRAGHRFDFLGMLMLSPGLALLLYGLSRIPAAGGVTSVGVLVPGVLGLALVAGFVARAARAANPLIDLSLFKDRTFRVAVGTMALFAVAFFGTAVIGPAYFLLVRGDSALQTGLLLAPQGLGAMLTMPLAGAFTDRFGPRKVVVPGIVLIALSMVVFTGIEADTPYWQLLAALFVMGLGMGAAMMPITSAALASLRPHQIPGASSATNIIQQTAGAVGSAVLSIVLAGLLAAKFDVPTDKGQLAATAALNNPRSHADAAPLAASSFAHTFVWGLVLVVLCLVPALFLPNRSAGPMAGPPPEGPPPGAEGMAEAEGAEVTRS